MLSNTLFRAAMYAMVFVLALCSKKNGKMGKSRSLFFKPGTGSLEQQILDAKRMHSYSRWYKRNLVIALVRDANSSGVSYDLCDVFNLPSDIQCVKKGQLKCPKNETVNSDKLVEAFKSKKRSVVYCSEPPLHGHTNQRNAYVAALSSEFPMNISAKSLEGIDYVKDLLHVNKPKTPFVVINWVKGKHLQGRCTHNVAESLACAAFKEELALLVKQTKLYCSPDDISSGVVMADNSAQQSTQPLCYVTGLTIATPTEVSIVSAAGFRSFKTLWQGELMGLHISPASSAVMELGLMLGASTFMALDTDDISNDFVEYERMIAKKSFCASPHHTTLSPLKINTAAVAIASVAANGSWCDRMRMLHSDAQLLAQSDQLNYVAAQLRGSLGAPTPGQDDSVHGEGAVINWFVTKLALLVVWFMTSWWFQFSVGVGCTIIMFLLLRYCLTGRSAAMGKTL